MKLLHQIRVNLLAIISLTVALSTLSYNTYRNELTEENRNTRHAGFELLMELNKFQLLIDFAHYDKNEKSGNPLKGWSHVLYINDLSTLVSNRTSLKADLLRKTWSKEWETIRINENSNKKMTTSINSLRKEVLSKITRLD